MKLLKTNTIALLAVSLFIANNSFAGAMEDDPLLTKVMINKLEVGEKNDAGKRPLRWEADFWVGKDLHKFWLKSSGERENGNQATSTSALYSKAIDPYWDIQGGLLHDTVSGASRDYLELGFKGVAPYFFETDTSIAVGKNGHSKLSFSTEYELMLTQKLVLSPEVEFTAYGKSDEKMGVGSGFSSAEAGLRLRYEVQREFAPYIGVNFSKKFGQTADFAKAEGESASDTQIVMGIRAWF